MKKDNHSSTLRSVMYSLIGAALALVLFGISGSVSQAAGTGKVAIDIAQIGGNGVIVNGHADEMPDSDDRVFYLFAERMYQKGPSGDPVASTPFSDQFSLWTPLGFNTADSRLYDKFQIAVKQGGNFVPVTGTMYISNPEALSLERSNIRVTNSKKGLILDEAKLEGGEIAELGVQQVACYVNLEDIIGGDGNVPFDYNGATWRFDSASVSRCDKLVKACASQKAGVTIVLLNPYAKGEEFMISPSGRSNYGKSRSHLMNTSEEQGLTTLAATVSFLAWRYNGKNGLGQVDYWVVGNEVNNKNTWNYSGIADEMEYAQLYANALRVCYNAVKSQLCEHSIIAMSVDQNWTAHHDASWYSARSMVEAVNHCIRSEGNIDWAIAENPYNYPKDQTAFWAPADTKNSKDAKAAPAILHSIDTGYLTMQNIEQLSAYMSLGELKNTKGQVRPILLTDCGYSSAQGEEAQASAMIYAYQRAMADPNIALIILGRQTDDAAEVKQGLATGMTAQDGTRKLAFEYFQHMNHPEGGEYIKRAAAFMGIPDWAAAMKGQ